MLLDIILLLIITIMMLLNESFYYNIFLLVLIIRILYLYRKHQRERKRIKDLENKRLMHEQLIEQQQKREKLLRERTEKIIKERKLIQERARVIQENKLKKEISLLLLGLKEMPIGSYYANINHQRKTIMFHYIGCSYSAYDKISLLNEKDLRRFINLKNSGYKIRQCSRCILTDVSKILKSLSM